LPEVDSPLPFMATTTRRVGGSVAVGDTIAADEVIETVISATGAGEGRFTVNVRGAAAGRGSAFVRVLVGSGSCP
jgi:hypothetical protein